MCLICSVVLFPLVVASASLFLRSYHFLLLSSIKMILLERLVNVILLLVKFIHLISSSGILLHRLFGSTKSEQTHKSTHGFFLLFFFFSYYFFFRLCQWYRGPKACSFFFFLLHHTRFECHILSDSEVIISWSVNSFVKWATSLIVNCRELAIDVFNLILEWWACL